MTPVDATSPKPAPKELKRESESKLKFARQPSLTADNAKVFVRDIHIGCVKIWMIQSIVGFRAELQAHPLGKRKILGCGNIPLGLPIATHFGNIEWKGADLVGGVKLFGSVRFKDTGIKPVVYRALVR